jgi:hypothetical protein
MECLQFPLKPSMLGRLAGRLWAGLGFGAARRVAIGRQIASSQKEVVIHTPHFGAAESRPALHSRAAG